MIQAKAVAERLGGARLLGRGVVSDLGLYRAIRRGLDPRVIDRLLESGTIQRGELGVLAIAARTLARRRAKGERLTAEESDKVVRVARLVLYAVEVFADEALAAEWLREPNGALGNQVPLEMLATDAGARLVETTLDRIAFGDYS